jgi:hypothetical protein
MGVSALLITAAYCHCCYCCYCHCCNTLTGIYLDQTPTSARLERNLLEVSLKHKLEAPSRPTLEELSAQGIVHLGSDGTSSSGTQRDMERYFAARQVCSTVNVGVCMQ